jgi:phospholipase D
MSPARLIFCVALALLPAIAHAACEGASVDICFRPGADSCEAKIVDEIDHSETSLLVQAYGFTSTPIIQSLRRAHDRGVVVRVLLDKDNDQPRYTGATYLTNAAVPVRIDDRVTIAHNKVIVIDGKTTIGGSFNYTVSAEKRNAENVTFVRSQCVASEFAANFEKRWAISRKHSGIQSTTK